MFETAAQADSDARVREVAVRFLGDRGKQSTRLLRKISRKDPDVGVRRAAEQTIERIKKSGREGGGR